MPKRKRLFLKILKAELEDCLEDVEDLTLLAQRRHDRDEITSHVFKENSALLTRELQGFRMIIDDIGAMDPDAYDQIIDLAAASDELIKRKVAEYEDPEAVYGIAKRKLLKVLRYMEAAAEV